MRDFQSPSPYWGAAASMGLVATLVVFAWFFLRMFDIHLELIGSLVISLVLTAAPTFGVCTLRRLSS